MSKLTYVYWCNHLTEVACQWRGVDYNARAFVRGLKEEEFNGYLDVKLNGVNRRYTTANIEQLVRAILPLVGQRLRDDIEGPISLVPIPNSGMAKGVAGSFRSVELARMVASGYGADAEVCDAIVWDAPRPKAHHGHEYRHPDLFEPHMVLTREPAAKVVLFDDVLTSGSQMIAAARMLTKRGFEPQRGLVVARATKVQVEGKLFSKRQDELELSVDPFDFDDF